MSLGGFLYHPIVGAPSGRESGIARTPAPPCRSVPQLAVAALINTSNDGHDRGKNSHLPIGGDLLLCVDLCWQKPLRDL